MIKNIISVIFNLFNFDKPRFARLHYADMVISGKAYFLMSWELEGGYKLKIKNLNFCTYKRSGSAYVAIPSDTDHLELVVANVWKSTALKIELQKESIESQIDFAPVKQFEELTARSVYAPQIGLVLKAPEPNGNINKLQIPVFTIQIKNLTQT